MQRSAKIDTSNLNITLGVLIDLAIGFGLVIAIVSLRRRLSSANRSLDRLTNSSTSFLQCCQRI